MSQNASVKCGNVMMMMIIIIMINQWIWGSRFCTNPNGGKQLGSKFRTSVLVRHVRPVATA
jgi:hypothetical protein